MYSHLFLNIVYPGLELIRGRQSARIYRTVKQTEWYSEDRVREYQWEELSKLLVNAFENVPFYRKRFQDAGITPNDMKCLEDLPRLPVLTKTDVRRNKMDLISTQIPRKHLVPGRTGGSTGEPMHFYHDKRALDWISAVRMRNVERAGFEWGDKHVYMSGSHFDYSKSMELKVRLRNVLMRRRSLSFAGIDEKQMMEYLKYIQQWKPVALWGYASALYLLALLVKKEIGSMNIPSIIASSETLLPHQRELIEEVFDCRVLDYYATREFSIACECEQHEGFHIDAESVLVEVVKHGKPLPEGEIGQILITDLHNYGFPFIRYAVGDVGRLSSRKCVCGRGLPIMESVEGRISDIIITSEGRFVSPPAFTIPIGDVEGIEQYQLVHDRADELTINIVKNERYTDADTTYLRRCLKSILGEEVELIFRFVDHIPVGESGKRRVIISTVSRNYL